MRGGAPAGHRRHSRRETESAAEPSGPEASRLRLVNLNKTFGSTTIVCRYPDGTRLDATFHGDQLGRLDVE